jgi:cytochrome c oxidase assembly protein subunit 17
MSAVGCHAHKKSNAVERRALVRHHAHVQDCHYWAPRLLTPGKMGASASTPAPPPAEVPKKKKICCACPETKAARDACTVQHGPEDPACAALIEAHNKCLRSEGFNV